jgi:hypothetical protein
VCRTDVAPRAIALALVAALLAYAVFALAVRQWWLSGLAAPVVAAMLWRRHRRARFATYVFLTVAAARGLASGVWPVSALAAGAVLLMQCAAARRAWPRLVPGAGRRSDRMTAP